MNAALSSCRSPAGQRASNLLASPGVRRLRDALRSRKEGGGERSKSGCFWVRGCVHAPGVSVCGGGEDREWRGRTVFGAALFAAALARQAPAPRDCLVTAHVTDGDKRVGADIHGVARARTPHQGVPRLSILLRKPWRRREAALRRPAHLVECMLPPLLLGFAAALRWLALLEL